MPLNKETKPNQSSSITRTSASECHTQDIRREGVTTLKRCKLVYFTAPADWEINLQEEIREIRIYNLMKNEMIQLKLSKWLMKFVIILDIFFFSIYLFEMEIYSQTGLKNYMVFSFFFFFFFFFLNHHHHHHHQLALITRSSLDSLPPSIPIALGRFSKLCPVSSQSWCKSFPVGQQ